MSVATNLLYRIATELVVYFKNGKIISVIAYSYI